MKRDFPLEVIRANSEQMSLRLKVMSHSERLMMLCRMSDEEVTVGELVELTGLSQSAVSQHLSRLRDAGLVEVRPDGQVRYYRLMDATVRAIIDALCDICATQEKSAA